MKKIAAVILLIVLVAGCGFSGNPWGSNAASNRIAAKTSTYLAKKYQMSIGGKGGQIIDGKVKEISVLFIRQKGPVSLEEGRKMIVDCVEEFISAYNSNPRVRPFLYNSPFGPKNFSISIIYYNENLGEIFFPDITVFSASRGEVGYCTNDPEKEFGYKTEVYEPYEEALALARGGSEKESGSLLDRTDGE